jgi:hypothetical protein
MPGTLSVTMTKVDVQPRSAALSGAGMLDVAGMTPVMPIAVPLSSSGTLTAPIYATYARAATMSGVGTLVATGLRQQPMAAPFTSTGALTATVVQPIQVVAIVTASFPFGNNVTVAFTGWTPALNDVVVSFPMNTAASLTGTPSAGWVNPLGGSTTVSTTQQSLGVAYHLVTAAEVSAGTTSYTMSGYWSGGSIHKAVAIVLRNVNPASVVDSINTSSSTTSVATHVLPGLTGSNLSTNSAVFSCASLDTITNPYTAAPAGWTMLNGIGMFQNDQCRLP